MFDPSDDFPTVADGLETVTLLRPGSSAAATIGRALRQSPRTRPAEGDVACTAAEAVWHLPAAELAAPPRVGDAIADASGRRWTIVDVRSCAQGRRWRCAARDLVVAAGLDAYVDLERAVWTKGADGVQTASWTVRGAGLRASIRPAVAEADAADGLDRAVSRCTILLADETAVEPGDRFRCPDGAVWSAVAVRRREGVWEIDAERL